MLIPWSEYLELTDKDKADLVSAAHALGWIRPGTVIVPMIPVPDELWTDKDDVIWLALLGTMEIRRAGGKIRPCPPRLKKLGFTRADLKLVVEMMDKAGEAAKPKVYAKVKAAG